jgi:ABC-type phosphate/phosphonate transport system permease subunit
MNTDTLQLGNVAQRTRNDVVPVDKGFNWNTWGVLIAALLTMALVGTVIASVVLCNRRRSESEPEQASDPSKINSQP